MGRHWITGLALAASLIASACSSTSKIPLTRPMTDSTLDSIGEVDVVVVREDAGLGVGWDSRTAKSASNPLSQAATAAGMAMGGVLPLLIKTATETAIDAGPASRARKMTEMANAEITSSELSAALGDEVDRARAGLVPAGSRLELDDARVRRVYRPDRDDDTLYIDPDYTLSDDGKALRVVVDAALFAPGMKYDSPYGRQRQSRPGYVYGNRFLYFSEPVRIAKLDAAQKARLADATRAVFDALYPDGNIPQDKLDAALADAGDTLLTQEEEDLLSIWAWVEDDAKRLREELATAHGYISQALVMNLTDTTVPKIDGNHMSGRLSDGRRMVRVGKGAFAGAYVFEPDNVSSVGNFGNAKSIPRAARREIRRAECAELRAQMRSCF